MVRRTLILTKGFGGRRFRSRNYPLFLDVVGLSHRILPRQSVPPIKERTESADICVRYRDQVLKQG